METKARYALIGAFTVGVIAAVFAFVFWLHNTGGLGKRAVYQIRFESSVAGLLVGANVLFNGIRVGEVTGLELEKNNPRQVLATIAVDTATPVRTDTLAGIDFQGLTGAPVITLAGGSATAPKLAPHNGELPLLTAAPGAGQSLSQAARDTLHGLDKILADNSTPLRDAIAAISTFSQALARNSDRVDGILAGVERMTGGPRSAKTKVYDLTAPRDIACARASAVQLIIPEPTAVMAFNSDKILVSGTAADPAKFEQGQFADNIPAAVQAKILQAFEDAKCFDAVARPLDGLEAGYDLILEIRNFRIVMSPDPIADVEFSAKLVADKAKIVGFEVFHETEAVQALDPVAGLNALDAAFGKAVRGLVSWTAGKIAAQEKSARP